ncbi:MAG: nicotinamide mononucleotide transporter [Clostridia bacterium]|nr:nicotinamide mononucleotide transporter [Clostridia bacterium]
MKRKITHYLSELFITPFTRLTRFEVCLWLTSAAVIAVSFALIRENPLTLAASLVGVTALIFLARGAALGQILILLFSLLYGLVSFQLHYWGEMLTYLGMTAPMAVFALISWVRHPYKDSGEVAVQKLSGKQTVGTLLLTVAATALFGGLLWWLDTPNLPVSVLSVSTSFLAATLTFLRSPYYALGYAANDVVLIVLWVAAAVSDPVFLPMVLCFVTFLVNDLYGFYCWRRMERRQWM